MSSRPAIARSRWCFVASRSSSTARMFDGSASATRRRPFWSETGNRRDALERAQRDLLDRVPGGALVLEVDVRKPVAPRERAGDAVRLRVTLVGEGLREGADSGPRLGGGQAVLRDDLDRAYEVGDEIGERRKAAADSSVFASRVCLGIATECLRCPQSSRRLQGHRDPSPWVIGRGRQCHENEGLLRG